MVKITAIYLKNKKKILKTTRSNLFLSRYQYTHYEWVSEHGQIF
jgi:hypothetical protein